MKIKKSLFDNLNNFFGFENFKGEQEAIITSILSHKDTFVIMPTGAGKSMCYQLPALISEGTALVISPLIALMKNQVDQLRAFGGKDNIAHFLNSSLNKAEIAQVKLDVQSGETKLLYLAPESIGKTENLEFLKSIPISFVAVDEAHCISEWGHDFRPEYRKIRSVISQIGDNISIIALTATATPKVQQDIQKNLGMQNATVFKSSFNRSNLFYEIRPKKNVMKEMIRFIKNNSGKSGIIYCLSRKKVEEVAEVLVINGIKALAYHAGLDSKQRGEIQDRFLMEDIDVIVATIAFGMGIDKPDVRFVIHHDIPKSMEGYYQETGRAGRDGGEGHCLAFYSEKDVEKLSKFMKDRPVTEREIGTQILKEVIDYAESSVCRRVQILHYFGEIFLEAGCNQMCDNCKHPKDRFDAEWELLTILKLVQKVGEKFDDIHLVNLIMGINNQAVHTYEHDKLEEFGIGKEKGLLVWKSVIRQAILYNYLNKDIEQYGVLSLSKFGKSFIENPYSVKFRLNIDFTQLDTEDDEAGTAVGGALDEDLFNLLKDLRKKVAKSKNVPPFVIFQDPSLEEMATLYPVNLEELKQISGVGAGKAMRYGQVFIELIIQYVDEHEIDRPMDMLVKSQVNKSGLKVSIIQNIDRKVPLEDIANQKGLSYVEMLHEVETIVSSGTKININYYLDEIIDEDRQEEAYEYFKKAEVDSVDVALKSLGEEDYTREEIQLMRIQFLSDYGN